MKKVTFIAALALITVGAINTQASNTTRRTVNTEIAQEEKVKIAKEDLPDAVKKALASDAYKAWEISEAYEYKATHTYEVELKNGDQKKTVKLDKDGKVL